MPLPPGAEAYLRPDNPRLEELRRINAIAGVPFAVSGQDELGGEELRWFRGDTRLRSDPAELPRAARLKVFILLDHLRQLDGPELLERLREDGLFGCWTYDYPALPRVSWELLTSITVLLFLERELGILGREGLRVVDLQAGYGGLAHRLTTAAALSDMCCLDTRAEATFLCEYYLHLRGCAPARAVALGEASGLDGKFDLAIGAGGFVNRPREDLRWWVERLRAWDVRTLLLLSGQLKTLEPDGLRLDFMPVLAEAGYRLIREEPVIDDPAVRAMVKLHARFLLFEHTG